MRSVRRVAQALFTVALATEAIGCVTDSSNGQEAPIATGSVAQAFTGAVNTPFNHTTQAFHFGNDFQNYNQLPDGVDFRSGGLCGGMTYAAFDYYNAHMTIPNQDYRPADGTVLQQYIYARQFESLYSNLDKWAELIFNPFGVRNGEFFNWGLDGSANGRISELRSFLDNGVPVPLGLKGTQGTGDHQVLAIGYQMGNYLGDLGANQGDFKIFIVDPNNPGEAVTTLVPNVAGQYYTEAEHPDESKWVTYFVDKNYVAAIPPNVQLPTYPDDGLMHELLVHAGTGSDDMRGGGDDVNLTVNLKSGASIALGPINQYQCWISNYDHWVRMMLPAPLDEATIAIITLSDTFGGGIDGDNWDMTAISVNAVGYLPRYQIAHSGFHRFQADSSRNLPLSIDPAPALPPPVLNALVPNWGAPTGGNFVHITGNNFDINGGTRVFFSGVEATSVSCSLPTDCYALSPSGNADVYVSVNVDGVTSGASLRYDYLPTITGISERVGYVGDTVTINGRGFVAGQTTIKFGTVAASTVTCDLTTCSVTVPANIGRVPVTASINGVTSASSQATWFQYEGPKVTALSQPDGPITGGTFFVVSGEGFDMTPGATQVLFGGVPALYVNCSYTTSCTGYAPPALKVGPVDVQVASYGATSTPTTADLFVYDPYARIASFGYYQGGSVQLNGNAPAGGASIAVTSSDPRILAPTTVTIPAGTSSATFTLPINPSVKAETLTITTAYMGSSASSNYAVAAMPPLTFVADSGPLAKGTSELGYITLDVPAPAGGATIALTSSSSAVISVPSSVVVPAGSYSTTFSMTSGYTGKFKFATITAMYNGNSATQTVEAGTGVIVGGGGACAPKGQACQ